MTWFRRRAALYAAVVPAARSLDYSCEPLERRVLLSNDPVIVLTETFNLTTWPGTVNETEVVPWLYKNPGEFQWDLGDGDWNTTDGDSDGYGDNVYGWNFSPIPGYPAGTPDMIRYGQNSSLGAHGATIVDKVLRVLKAAGTSNDVRVRIMHVIGSGPQIANYVIDQKQNRSVNIVAVSNSNVAGSNFSRADAAALRDAGILLFVGSSNSGLNQDTAAASPGDPSFFHATPRFGTQQQPVATIIPVTTDPAIIVTDFGINSFYFAMSGTGLNIDAQSYATATAATYAALAVEAYQDAHSGANPTTQQIKSAMMSGLTYQSNLNNKTISHEYFGNPLQRQNGGVLDLAEIIQAINETPAITGVSISAAAGSTVQFNLNSVGEPTNWTVSWGDNSFGDQSGTEVLPGDIPTASHAFRRDIQPHTYYPTIYAMIDTTNGRRVYVPTGAAQPVLIDTDMKPTSGKEDYVLSRSGNNLVVTLGSVTQTFTPGELPRCILQLGAGGDTVTIDLSNGDPLHATQLTVGGSPDNLIRVIGKSTPDTIVNGRDAIVIGTTLINKQNQGLPVSISGAGGDDALSSTSIGKTTLAGGAGNDKLTLISGKAAGLPETLQGGDGIDTVFGVSAPDVMDVELEYFRIVDQSSGAILVNRYDSELLLVNVTRATSGAATFGVFISPLEFVISSLGAMTYGAGDESVPCGTVTSLVVNGQNTEESLEITSAVNVTVNASGGDDDITVSAPNVSISAGSGSDYIIVAASSSASVDGSSGDDYFEITAPNATVIGGNNDDDITVAASNASIDGGTGDDEFWTGNTGYYFVKPGTGTNTFNGGNGIDYVQLASGAADTIYLGGGNDIVDALYDFGDNDYLDGGAGTDTLKIYEGLERTNLISIEEIDEIPWPG